MTVVLTMVLYFSLKPKFKTKVTNYDFKNIFKSHPFQFSMINIMILKSS